MHEKTAEIEVPVDDLAPSAQSPVSRVADAVGRARKPAGLVALGSGAGGVLVFLFSHAVTLHDLVEVARAGWREIALLLLFIVLLIVLRHVHKLQTEWATVTRMFAAAVAANQRINEEQNRVLHRIERTLLQMQGQPEG